MNRLAELLLAVAGVMRAAETAPSRKMFADVRVELDRYDLADLLAESTQTPGCRVCFLAGKPVPRADGGDDMDVSVAIVVIAGPEGRANPDFASADMAALDLITGVSQVLKARPSVGLGKIADASVGQSLVAVSQATSKKKVAIALVEAKWRLLEVATARPAVQGTLETDGRPWGPTSFSVNGGQPQPIPGLAGEP
ncbi:hypothetical protein AB4099_05505 [Bosea sp. 2KB_26]|uniref:hypothetical protein n=1 Tax=Bosea sp. 2KB_26 TaxID=3237475 RepID=UPI003F8F1189